MGKLALKTTALCAFVVVVAGASAACSSSSAAPGTTGTGGDGGGGGGGGGGAECSAISASDAQALVPETATVKDEGTQECQITYGGTDSGITDVKVNYYLSDADLTFYNSQSEGASDHAITGIGDKAYWNEVIPQQSAPYLAAHKGNVTCTILSNEPPDTTMVTSPGEGGTYTVTDANALAYVQLMGKVCNDVLNAAQ